MLRWLWLSLVILIFDQATKYWVEAGFQYREQLPVIDGFFNLTLVYNTGAAFSFLSDAGGWQRWFFTLVAVVISVVLLVWLKRLQPGDRLTAAAISLVLGGAVGNLVDRLIHGHVIDFLLFYYEEWAWPAFNIADSSIFIGVAILILGSFKAEQADISKS